MTETELSALKTMLALNIGDIHDKAHDAWCWIHKPLAERDYYECLLCGETMYPCVDYTHAEDCPFEIVEAAIDAFGEAIDNALLGRGEAGE